MDGWCAGVGAQSACPYVTTDDLCDTYMSGRYTHSVHLPRPIHLSTAQKVAAAGWQARVGKHLRKAREAVQSFDNAQLELFESINSTVHQPDTAMA